MIANSLVFCSSVRTLADVIIVFRLAKMLDSIVNRPLDICVLISLHLHVSLSQHVVCSLPYTYLLRQIPLSTNAPSIKYTVSPAPNPILIEI